ncbi:MAG: ATP-binding cassette domain-containing protein [Candidatus Eisenbacteria bacterium]
MFESVVVEFGSGLPGARLALAGVDVALRCRECVAVIGPTGAGKTSLLEVGAGLLAPARGRAFLEDGGRVLPLKSGVGLVYQFPELQFFEETVYDDVAFGPRKLGVTGDEIDGRVERALESAGLAPSDFASRSPSALSAGEKRRAAIAGILALERPFLLLDEPTAGLDPASREGIIELLSAESGTRGVVVVSHDLELVDRLASRVLVMNEGRIVADGDAQDVLSDVAGLTGIGLAPPARHVLLDLVRERAPEEVPRVSEALFAGRLAKAL